MGAVTLLVGGARSGKSALAVRIGERHAGEVLFVATAEPLDDDMRARIAAHRLERPGWPTVEAPVELADAIDAAPPDALVIVDCVTVWVGNLFVHVASPPARARSYADMSDALDRRPGPAVVVSNEVGMGVHPESALGRDYRDELGRVNQRLAASAGTALLLIAGRAVVLSDPWDLLP